MSRCPYCGQKDCCGADLDPKLDDALAKVERLRAALTALVDAADHGVGGIRASVIDAAHDALRGEGGE